MFFFHYVVCFQRQNVFFSPFQPNGALNGFSPVFLDVKRVFWKWKEYSTFMQPSIQLSRSSLLSLLLSAPLLLSIDIEYWKYSRIRLHHPAPDRTKVVDISGWMIKPVGPNSSCKCQLYCENNQIRWCWVALLRCVDLFHVSRAWACPGSQLFPSHVNLVRFVGVILHEWNAITYVAQAATPAIRAICADLSAQMFPLSPLKVADITGGLDDISRWFIM